MDCVHCDSSECYVVHLKNKRYIHCPTCEAHGPYCRSEEEATRSWKSAVELIALGRRYFCDEKEEKQDEISESKKSNLVSQEEKNKITDLVTRSVRLRYRSRLGGAIIFYGRDNRSPTGVKRIGSCPATVEYFRLIESIKRHQQDIATEFKTQEI